MRVLLHICCGVCAAGVAQGLINEGHSVTGFFYNPNIHPEEEYLKRLEASREVAEKMNFELIEAEYDHSAWRALLEIFSDEPEGGTRCKLCYGIRLEKTFKAACEQGYDFFTTTLTVSPLKDAAVINEIGESVGGGKFMKSNFKKQDGFKRSIELAKEWGLHRQIYCGCEFGR